MRRLIFRTLALCALMLPAACFAQDAGGLTWVRHFKVSPEHSMAFVELLKEHDSPVFDSLMKEGKIEAWGIFTPFTMNAHSEFTHGVWVRCKNWESVDHIVQRFERVERQRSEEENAKLMQKFASMSNFDDIHDNVMRRLVTVDAGRTNTGSAEQPRYMKISFYKVKPTMEDETVELFKTYAVPVFEELTRSGTVLGAGLSKQEIVNSSDFTHVSYAMFPDLKSMDRTNEAFAKSFENRGPGAKDSLDRDLSRDMDLDAYHSTIFRIVHVGGAN